MLAFNLKQSGGEVQINRFVYLHQTFSITNDDSVEVVLLPMRPNFGWTVGGVYN